MTYKENFTLPEEILDQIASSRMGCLPELIRIIINTAMQVERQRYLGAEGYERSEDRRGHANG